MGDLLDRLHTALALAGSVLISGALSVVAAGQALPVLAFTHVTVVDVASGKLQADQALIIVGNRIARVGPAESTPVPPGATVIDAPRTFVIPGLWDMHVHLFRHFVNPPADVHDRYFALFLANGVTGVRDMWTTLEDYETISAWRRAAAAGALLGPRVEGSSTVVDGVPPIWPQSIHVTDPAAARRVVDSLAHGGAATIKVYTNLSRDVYFAIVTEAHRLGLPFAGHLPLSIRASEASDSGQKSIEHLGFIDDCSTALDSIVKLRMDPSLPRPEGGVAGLMLRTYSDSLCNALFRRFVKNGTWQVPTLAVQGMAGVQYDSVLAADPHLPFITADERARWERRAAQIPPLSPQQADARHRMIQLRLKIVGAMQRAGVPILAGTDVANPWIVAGFSLHDELAFFVQAGMTPLAALQTATLNPARYFGAVDSLGTVAPGKIADLVLLEANPLDDIRNTERIRAVVANGRFLSRPVLDSLLATVRQ